LSKEELERQESFTGYGCQRIKYLSDGFKVVGFIWKPKNSEAKKLPLVIANRVGNREYGKLSPPSFFIRLSQTALSSSLRNIEELTAVRE
jgi:hypothetical protein